MTFRKNHALTIKIEKEEKQNLLSLFKRYKIHTVACYDKGEMKSQVKIN